jgi:uncharacterized membrane protein YccC
MKRALWRRSASSGYIIEMDKKNLLVVLAGGLLLMGLYEAYKQSFTTMWVFFVAMAFSFAMGMRGRNTWIR